MRLHTLKKRLGVLGGSVVLRSLRSNQPPAQQNRQRCSSKRRAPTTDRVRAEIKCGQ